MRRVESKFTLGVFVTSSFALIIAVVSLVVSLLGRRVTPLEDLSSSYVPTRFAVSALYDTPARIVNRSEKLWANAVTALLEAYYRHQGILTSLLKPETYLRLSDRSLWEAAALLTDEPDEFDGAPASQFVNIAPRALRSVVPDITCPENGSCDITKLTKNNVLHCEMKETHFATTVPAIKRLLYTHKRPLILSMPAVKADFIVPCSDDRVSGTELCRRGLMKIDGVTHGVIRTSTRLEAGQYFVPSAPARASLDGYESFLLVGYNDDLHTSTGITKFSSVRPSKGAFIVKGFKGTTGGYTIPSLSGRDGEVSLQHLCRSGRDPYTWIPHGGAKSRATFLNCRDSAYCDTSKKYWLVAHPNQTEDPSEQPYVVEDEYGLTTTYYTGAGEKDWRQMREIPFWSLGHAFEAGFALGDEMCGYWKIPYELVDLAISLGGDIGASPVAFDMPVKWSRSSYAKGNHGDAYTNISRSTGYVVSDEMRST